MNPSKFIVMHKTNPYWEAGGLPSKELIANVGKHMGELAKSKVLLDGDGLRASSLGVRLKFTGGERTIVRGPFTGDNELPAAFTKVRAGSLDEAIEIATREAQVLGDVEIDIRPLTEVWDLGMGPKPEGVTTTRYMILRKATRSSEAGASPSAEQRAALQRLDEETKKRVAFLGRIELAPSGRGRRYKNAHGGVRVTDGPFAESKELVGGYVMIGVDSLGAACDFAEKYFGVVETDEMDVREVVSSS